MNTTQTQIGNGLPSKESFRTLVMLEEQSHQDKMVSLISEDEHKTIYKSWKSIRASLDAAIAEQDEDPIELGNGEIIHVYEAKDWWK